MLFADASWDDDGCGAPRPAAVLPCCAQTHSMEQLSILRAFLVSEPSLAPVAAAVPSAPDPLLQRRLALLEQQLEREKEDHAKALFAGEGQRATVFRRTRTHPSAFLPQRLAKTTTSVWSSNSCA